MLTSYRLFFTYMRTYKCYVYTTERGENFHVSCIGFMYKCSLRIRERRATFISSIIYDRVMYHKRNINY